MPYSDTHRPRTAVGLQIARACGRSCFKGSKGFTLIEVQVAIVVFAFAMIAVLGYARVNGSLISAVENERAVDGYLDLASQRLIVTITGEPGTTGDPESEVELESIDESGSYPIVEISTQQVVP